MSLAQCLAKQLTPAELCPHFKTKLLKQNPLLTHNEVLINPLPEKQKEDSTTVRHGLLAKLTG